MGSKSDYVGAVVVIPTRNRAAIAKNAIRSTLSQGGRDVQVMVSDNSTLPEEVRELESYCREMGDERLRYVRPPRPLSMAEHWEWAIRQALDGYEFNHFIYLTDRMVFKEGELAKVLGLAAAHPDRVITYNHDRVVDHARPIRVEQHPYTGELLEIESAHLAGLFSRGVMHPCTPRMLNCVAPRAALEKVGERFGTVFGSIAPDFCFGFRCLAVLDSFLYYDCPALFHYALDRSNGTSALRGELSRDSADFAANLPVPNSNRNYATPVPGLITNANAIFNEYLIVRAQTKSPRFPALDRDKYFEALAWEIGGIENPEAKREMLAQLTFAGWVPGDDPTAAPVAPPEARSSALARKLLSPRSISQSVRWRLSKLRRLSRSSKFQPAWLFLARRFGVGLPHEHEFVFDSIEEAFDFMNRFPRRPLARWPEQEELLQSRPVGRSGGDRRELTGAATRAA